MVFRLMSPRLGQGQEALIMVRLHNVTRAETSPRHRTRSHGYVFIITQVIKS